MSRNRKKATPLRGPGFRLRHEPGGLGPSGDNPCRKPRLHQMRPVLIRATAITPAAPMPAARTTAKKLIQAAFTVAPALVSAGFPLCFEGFFRRRIDVVPKARTSK